MSSGCAGNGDPAHFAGRREPRRAEPEAVKDVRVHTEELETLGRVHDRCTLHSGFRPLKGETLSDVDCSEERLLWALHESAAEAGGEVLLGARCRSNCANAASCASRDLQCSAQVARYRSGPSANQRPLHAPRSVAPGQPAPSKQHVQRSDEPDTSLSFRILLDFEPSVRGFAWRRRQASEVREFSTLPLADQPLGDLAARCEGSCPERALRYSVLIAAGRLGAADVVGVRCFNANSGQSCVGTLAAPERDE